MRIEANQGYSVRLYLYELYVERRVLFGLISRQVKIRYSNASLGLLWAVLQPLIVLGMLLLVFTKVAQFPTEYGQSPLAYGLVGLSIWIFFSSSFSSSITIALSFRDVMGKVYFPRAYIAVIALSESFIVLLFCLAASVAAGGWSIGFHTFFLLPFIGILMLFTALISLFVIMSVIAFPDTRFISPVVIRVLLLATPITYAPSVISSSAASVINDINPLAALIDVGRYAISGFPVEDHTLFTLLIYFLVVMVIVLPMFIRFDRMLGDLI